MLARIDSVQNIGRFQNLESPVETKDFAKYNLILGYNGSGKTTLSNVLRLFSDREPEPESLFRDLSNGRTGASVAVRFDTGKVTFSPGCQRRPIYVFNPDFVADHVYHGETLVVKRFDESVVTKDQLKNPAIAKLEAQVREKKQQLSDLIRERSTLEEGFKRIKTIYSRQLNERIQGTRAPKMDMPTEIPSEGLDHLRARLTRAYEAYERAGHQAQLIEDAQVLESHPVVHLATDTLAVQKALSRVVDAEAQNKLKQKLEELRDFQPPTSNLETWFQLGFRFLQHLHTHGTPFCPLCRSDLMTSIDLLLREYEAYFSAEFESTTQEIDRLTQIVDTDLSRLGQNAQNLTTLLGIERKHHALVDAMPIDLDADQVSSLLRDIKSALTTKRTNLAQPADCGRSELIENYNSAVDVVEAQRQELIKALRREPVDQAKLLSEIRKTMVLCAAAEFDGEEEGGQINRYRNVVSAINDLESNVREVSAALAREIATLRNEARYVNGYLRRLGIRHFHIILEENSIADNVKVQFESGDSRSALRHSLSEGEKTTLALAYFLSKVHYEVIDNASSSLENTIIVIDDPVSSMDESRLHSTACLMHAEFNTARQLFVFSHNIPFMKFMSNVIGNPTVEANGHSVSARCDFYLTDVREELRNLPDALRNYTTTYFQKLSALINFTDNNVPYEEVRYVVPMFVRTVLETFLSFKFSILSQGSSKERAQTAGLDKLVSNIAGSIGLFKSFPKIGDTDATTVVSQLHDIRRMTDPYVHGSPHDLSEVSFISESELKGLARRALDVVSFFDRIHFERVRQLSA